ncbi:MAG: hypothetical protein HKN31_06600 [Pricia sp.]|nr:hypothetical protein [Pricia sp.]
MIKYAILFFFSLHVLQAQNADEQIPSEVQVGDILKIGKPETKTYKHIAFPRANFIIKRGGIVNYDRLKGEKVVVTSIAEKNDGTTKLKIKREDGGRFFGSHSVVVVADYRDALEAGELLMK